MTSRSIALSYTRHSACVENVDIFGISFPGHFAIWREISAFEIKKYIKIDGKFLKTEGKFTTLGGKV